MSNLPNFIDPDQLKDILTDLIDKTKIIFVTKSELRSQVETLTEEINSLKSRIEALENNQEV